MAWISEQKPKGKFYGFLAGSFLAFSWGHWHERIFGTFGIRCNRLYTQLAILGVRLPTRSCRLWSVTTSPASPDTVQTNSSPTASSLTTTSSPATSNPSCPPLLIQRALRSTQPQIHPRRSSHFQPAFSCPPLKHRPREQEVDLQPAYRI